MMPLDESSSEKASGGGAREEKGTQPTAGLMHPVDKSSLSESQQVTTVARTTTVASPLANEGKPSASKTSPLPDDAFGKVTDQPKEKEKAGPATEKAGVPSAFLKPEDNVIRLMTVAIKALESSLPSIEPDLKERKVEAKEAEPIRAVISTNIALSPYRVFGPLPNTTYVPKDAFGRDIVTTPVVSAISSTAKDTKVESKPVMVKEVVTNADKPLLVDSRTVAPSLQKLPPLPGISYVAPSSGATTMTTYRLLRNGRDGWKAGWLHEMPSERAPQSEQAFASGTWQAWEWNGRPVVYVQHSTGTSVHHG